MNPHNETFPRISIFSHLFLAFILICILFNLLGWPFYVQFQSALLDHLLSIFLLFGLLVGLFLVTRYSEFKKVRFFAMIFFAVTLLPVGGIGSIYLLDSIDILRTKTNPSIKKIDEVIYNSNKYRLYLENCGATCSYNIVANREIDLLIGIKLVFKKRSIEHVSNAFFISSDSSLQIATDFPETQILTEIID